MGEPLFAPFAPVDRHHVELRELEERRDRSPRITCRGDGARIRRILKPAGPEVREDRNDDKHQAVVCNKGAVEKRCGRAYGEHAQEQASQISVTELGGMLELEVCELVGHDIVNFALRHPLEKEVREGNGVIRPRKGIGHLAFSRWNQIDLLELYAEALSHAERAVAKISGRECLGLHAGDLEQGLRGNNAKKESANPPKHGGAKATRAHDAEPG